MTHSIDYHELVLLPEGRKILKRIIGIPLYYDPDIAAKKLKVLVNDFNPSRIISVGDFVLINLIKNAIVPDVSIIDYTIMREKTYVARKYLNIFNKILHIKNRRSTVNINSWLIIERIFSEKDSRTLLIVEGEEDLLVIPAILSSSDRDFVIYGQPREAMVVIISCKYVRYSILKFVMNNKFFKKIS